MAVAAALVVGGYLYFRLDDEIRRQVERLLADHYHHLDIHVGRARFDQDGGIAIYDVTLRERDPTGARPPTLAIDEMYLSGNLRLEEVLAGALQINRVAVRRATLRAVRRPDGRWSASALLPLPLLGDESPTIHIEDTTLIVADASRKDTQPWTVQGISLVLTPVTRDAAGAAVTRRFHVAGAATGLPARELRIEGFVDTDDGELDLTVTMAGLELSSDLLAALPGIAPAELHGTDLSGRADVTLRVARPADHAPPTWSAEVNIDRGRLVHALLPAPLSDFMLTAQADAKGLRIERLDGKCGPASVALSAERAGWSPKAPLALAARIVGLPLDDRVRSLVPESHAHLWQRFRPAGIVDAELRLVFDGRAWRPQVSVNCRGVSLTDAERFPYRLEQTTGQVEYRPTQADRPDELRIDLTGTGGGRPVRIEAELRVERQELRVESRTPPALESQPSTLNEPLGWLEISGTDVPLHEQLVAALPEEVERLVRSLEPQGSLDFRFRAEWKEPTPHDAEVTQEIRLKGCTIQYADFPYPLRHVQGLITEQEGHWTIHDVTARGAGDATLVKCRGEAIRRGDEWQVAVTIGAENVPLDGNLKRALRPAAQQVWDELMPQGRIDFTAHALKRAHEREPAIEFTLQPRDRSVSVEPAKFPYRLEQIEGVATYRAGRVEARNVQARHGRAVYSAAGGTWQLAPDGGWHVALTGVNVDRLSPDRELIAALPPSWQKAVERFQPSGMLGLYNGSVTLAKQGHSDHVAAAWDVNLDCHQAAVRGDLPLQSVTGGIRLLGRSDGASSYTAAELALDSVVWKDVQLTNVRGPVWIDASHCYLGELAAQKLGQPARRIKADAYGGTIAANAEIQHAGNPGYTLDVALGAASLARFANERPGGPRDVSGTASGRLVLSGTGRSMQTLSGRGELKVVDANIYKLPVLVAMLKVLSSRAPDTTAFNRCDMQFTIQGEHIYFQQLNLLGDAVNLYGKGESDFDRQLDLVFYTLIEPAMPIPFWKTIARQVSKQTLQLKVVGTWDEAEVQPQTLPGVNQWLDQIQTELQAGAATIAPSTATRDTAISPR